MMVNYIICMRFNGATTQMNIVDNATEERIKACETNTLYTRPKMKWWNWRTYKKQSNSAFLRLQTFKAVAIPLFKRQFFPCAVNFLLHSYFFFASLRAFFSLPAEAWNLMHNRKLVRIFQTERNRFYGLIHERIFWNDTNISSKRMFSHFTNKETLQLKIGIFLWKIVNDCKTFFSVCMSFILSLVFKWIECDMNTESETQNSVT